MAGSNPKSKDLRKRRRTKKTPDATKKPVSTDSNDNDSEEPTTFWDFMMGEYKITFSVLMLVCVPIFLYHTYLYFFLQRPEWLYMVYPQKIQRPAFALSDARQVLIVGTMSSGTTQMSHDLSSKLSLEIGHENSETNWSFVRDGTVSWFHGIRFLPRPGIDDTSVSVDVELPSETVTVEGEKLFQFAINILCMELRPNMGFHPFMFRDNGCSKRQSWDSCWKQECKALLKEEWGCALKDSPTCTTPYHKTLHQVRDPLKTVESLITKFCIDGVDGQVQPYFVDFARALFPQHNFAELSCIEASGYYLYEYNKAMLSAVTKGLIDETFQVEGSTPCDIAQIAGFMNASAAEGYPQQIKDHLLELCESWDSEANQPMESTKNKVNKGQLSLEWDDLLGGKHGSQKKEGDRDLQERLKEMTKELDYESYNDFV